MNICPLLCYYSIMASNEEAHRMEAILRGGNNDHIRRAIVNQLAVLLDVHHNILSLFIYVGSVIKQSVYISPSIIVRCSPSRS